MATVKDGMLIAQVQSHSNGGKTYNVRTLADNRWVCDCMTYRFTKGEVGRKTPCKHIREVVGAVGNSYVQAAKAEFSVVLNAPENKHAYQSIVKQDPMLRAIDF